MNIASEFSQCLPWQDFIVITMYFQPDHYSNVQLKCRSPDPALLYWIGARAGGEGKWNSGHLTWTSVHRSQSCKEPTARPDRDVGLSTGWDFGLFTLSWSKRVLCVKGRVTQLLLYLAIGMTYGRSSNYPSGFRFPLVKNYCQKAYSQPRTVFSNSPCI